MPVHWSTPIGSKIIFALKRAWPRFLWGVLGTWCAIGPIVLLLRSELASGIVTAVLLLLLLLCCAGVFMIWFRSRWTTLRELISETGRVLCFIIIGELGSEMTGVFKTIKVEMALVYAFTGFFIVELTKPKAPIKALGEMFSALRRKWLPYSR